MPSAGQASAVQAEQADGVLLEDLETDVRFDVQLAEVAEPPFRRQQWIVGAEQHLVRQREFMAWTSWGGKYFGDQPDRSM